MAFLDNSGDIILDAVLTDTGRMRLAKGDGSFRIAKFALGDDEIDYGLYDKNNPSGSAYYDLQILQTPVLEAFTNNASNLKSKLISINRTNILYLPVVELFTAQGSGTEMHASGTFCVAVDKATVDQLRGINNAGQENGVLGTGWLDGYITNNAIGHIASDQGLDTSQLSSELPLDADLIETQYIVEFDNRLGAIAPPTTTQAGGSTTAVPSFIDDDQIASYYFTLQNANGYVTNVGGTEGSSIKGPRGTRLQFAIKASLELNSSTFLFNKIGSTGTVSIANDGGQTLAANTYKYIDTTVRATGVSTGYRIDIPIRMIKYTG